MERSFFSFFVKAVKKNNDVFILNGIENSSIIFTENSDFPKWSTGKFFDVGDGGTKTIFFNIR